MTIHINTDAEEILMIDDAQRTLKDLQLRAIITELRLEIRIRTICWRKYGNGLSLYSWVQCNLAVKECVYLCMLLIPSI